MWYMDIVFIKGALNYTNRIKPSLLKVQKSNQTQMKKPDGKKCTPPAEKAEVFRNHFTQLYKKQPRKRHSIYEQLNQLPILLRWMNFQRTKK